jgi:hypothetical protein
MQNLTLCIQVAGHAAVSCQITCNMFSLMVSFSDVCLFMMRSAETSSTTGHRVIRSRALGTKHHWRWVFTHFLSLLSSHLLNSLLSENLFSLSLSSSLMHDVCGSLSLTQTLCDSGKAIWDSSFTQLSFEQEFVFSLTLFICHAWCLWISLLHKHTVTVEKQSEIPFYSICPIECTMLSGDLAAAEDLQAYNVGKVWSWLAGLQQACRIRQVSFTGSALKIWCASHVPTWSLVAILWAMSIDLELPYLKLCHLMLSCNSSSHFTWSQVAIYFKVCCLISWASNTWLLRERKGVLQLVQQQCVDSVNSKAVSRKLKL